MKFFGKIIILACAVLALNSCFFDAKPDTPEEESALSIRYVNQDAFNVMAV